MIPTTQLWERLYIGGRLDAEHLATSNPSAIASVISLCEEPIIRRAPGINYLHHPIGDAPSLAEGHLDAILDSLIENIRWGSVLLHCGSGFSRAPILAAAYMEAVGYKTLEAAIAEIAGRRPLIAPSPALLTTVRKYLR